MKPELHRPVRLDRIGPDGLDLRVEASSAECAALAARMNLPGVLALTCQFHLTRDSDTRVTANGRLHARVMQTCVVSLDDFEGTVEEAFRLRFVPAGEEKENPDPESDDEVPYEDTTLDLGEAAAEQLGLALDPYPRMPDAELPTAEAEDQPHPFAALAALRRGD
jgi:uncharacterized metal-binding protein YceD (DUF177 family)